jgi:RNA-directed DNA polymerase
MYVLEESDCAILPMKLTNNEDKTSAEPAEGRAQTKENDAQPHTRPTQGRVRVSQGLGGVRQKARASKQERFTALLHHLTIDLLRESYFALQRSAAPGVDGVSWQQYEQGLPSRGYRQVLRAFGSSRYVDLWGHQKVSLERRWKAGAGHQSLRVQLCRPSGKAFTR